MPSQTVYKIHSNVWFALFAALRSNNLFETGARRFVNIFGGARKTFLQLRKNNQTAST